MKSRLLLPKPGVSRPPSLQLRASVFTWPLGRSPTCPPPPAVVSGDHTQAALLAQPGQVEPPEDRTQLGGLGLALSAVLSRHCSPREPGGPLVAVSPHIGMHWQTDQPPPTPPPPPVGRVLRADLAEQEAGGGGGGSTPAPWSVWAPPLPRPLGCSPRGST